MKEQQETQPKPEAGLPLGAAPLLACPFCGAIPRPPEDISDPQYAGKWWQVQCPKCEAWRSGETPAVVSAKWNARAKTVGRWETDVMLSDVKRMNFLSETPCLLGITDSGEWQIVKQTDPKLVSRGVTPREAIDGLIAKVKYRLEKRAKKYLETQAHKSTGAGDGARTNGQARTQAG